MLICTSGRILYDGFSSILLLCGLPRKHYLSTYLFKGGLVGMLVTSTVVYIVLVTYQVIWLYRSVLQASLTEGPGILPHLVLSTFFGEQQCCYC